MGTLGDSITADCDHRTHWPEQHSCDGYQNRESRHELTCWKFWKLSIAYAQPGSFSGVFNLASAARVERCWLRQKCRKRDLERFVGTICCCRVWLRCITPNPVLPFSDNPTVAGSKAVPDAFCEITLRRERKEKMMKRNYPMSFPILALILQQNRQQPME